MGKLQFSPHSLLGVATPSFLFALVLLYLGFEWFGVNLSGLFSLEYPEAPWSWSRVWNLIRHLSIPIVVVGTAGTAGLIRVMRSAGWRSTSCRRMHDASR